MHKVAEVIQCHIYETMAETNLGFGLLRGAQRRRHDERLEKV